MSFEEEQGYWFGGESRGVHQGSKEKPQFSSLSEGTRLGEFLFVRFNSVIV